MLKGLFLPLWFFLSFSLRLIYEVTERISAKLGHIFTYDCYLKNLVRTPRAFTPRSGQNPLFGTDFEFWPNISLQRNTISTIGKKLVNLQGLLYTRPQNSVNFGSLVQKRLRTVAEFLLPPPNFRNWRHCQPCRMDVSRQTLACVM